MRTFSANTGKIASCLIGAALALAGCGSASNSETPGTTPPPAGGGAGGSAGSAGAPGAGGGAGGAAPSGGTPGTAGSPGGNAGSPGGMAGSPGGTAGTGGAPRPADAGTPPSDASAAPGGCPVQRNLTLAVHIVMNASWPGTLSSAAGMDKIHVWNLTKVQVNGTELSGNDTRTCGTVLPPFNLSGAAQLVTGGQKVHIEFPFSIWEAPTIPRLRSQGRLAGFNPGSALNIDGTVALIGLTMDDPAAAWPDSYTGIKAVDADGDGKLGFTAVPKAGDGFVQPPTGIDLLRRPPPADQVYVASRTVIGLQGMLTSCTEVSGTANVTFFDSHVVGCHIRGGAECMPDQIDFVDQARTIYKINGATFTAKQVPETATCADVRAALPM
jgi:prepilin-type processing-associated H-X9-DG protein